MADYLGEITMRSGDSAPLLALAVEDDMGVPVDITTASSIDIILTNEDGADPRTVPSDPPETQLVLPGAITDPTHGIVTHDWDPALVLRPGVVRLVVVAHFPTGLITAPSDRSAAILVRPNVESPGGTLLTLTTEDVIDSVAAALIAGNNIDITYDDLANTITIDVEVLTKADVGLGNVDNTADAVKPVSTPQQTALDAKAPVRRTLKADTTTAYAPVLADENVMVTLSNAAAITVTLPQDSVQPFPIGAEVDFLWIGVGQPTFAAGSGATVTGTPGLKLRAQWSAATAKKRAANTWVVIGDLSA